MNFYEVEFGDWIVRVRAGSFKTAINRALSGGAAQQEKPDSRHQKYFTVKAKVIARNVSPDDVIPDFVEREV